MAFSLFKGKKKSTDTIASIINDLEHTPFGVSESNVLYAGLNELGGYFFFQTVVVGEFYIKTNKGATLVLKGENATLNLNSDMPEFESDGSSVPNRSITKIDFQIDDAEIKTLQDSRITSIELKSKKQDILFTKYVGGDEEE